MKALMDPDREDTEIARQVFWACLPTETHELTSSGICALTKPKDANLDDARGRLRERTQFLIDFIKLWKTIPL